MIRMTSPVIAEHFARAVDKADGKAQLQVQIRAQVPPVMGIVRDVTPDRGTAEEPLPEGDFLYELVAEAFEPTAGRVMAITMTFAGEDVLWYATAPAVVQSGPSLIQLGGTGLA